MVERFFLRQTVQWEKKASSSAFNPVVPPKTGNQFILTKNTFKSDIVSIWRKLSASNQFVDIGVNVGQTMLEIMSLFEDLSYYGFEPNVSAYSIAQTLASVNNIKAILFPWACSDQAKPCELYASSLLDSSATACPEIRPNTYANVLPAWIASYPLDLTLGSVLRHCFMMKIDVEGSEYKVLRGAKNLISEKRPLILCEVLHAHRESEIGANNWHKIQILDLLKDLKYLVYQVNLDVMDREKFVGLSKVQSFQMNQLWKESPHTCDFLFVPEELSLELVSRKIFN